MISDMVKATLQIKEMKPQITVMVCSQITFDKVVSILFDAGTAYGVGSNTFLGIKILPSTDFESNEVFYFEKDADAYEFIKAVKELKKEGYTWDHIIAIAKLKLRGQLK